MVIRSLEILLLFLSSYPFSSAGYREYDLQDQTNYEYENDNHNDTIDGPGCRIPHLDLFSPTVMETYGKAPDLICKTGRSLFTEDSRFLYFNASALPFNYKSEQLTCVYRSFERKEGAEDAVRYSNSKPLSTHQPNEIRDEFIAVSCTDSKTAKQVYKDYFAFLPLKKVTEDRCNNADEKEMANKDEFLSPLVIGLDSISRLQFHRHFPRSSMFLRERLDAIEMMGYNKVAENTYPNLVIMLSGLTEEKLDKICLDDHKRLVDTCPIIWKKYHEKGYRSSFVEDAPGIAIFNYGAVGFQYQPTDYYLRPMYLEYERGVGYDNIGCGFRCLGSRSSLSFLLNYAEKTARIFRDKKYFAFHWSCSTTHDFFNMPTQVDETVEIFLQTLMKDNLLNRTLLIVMADHGPRILKRSNFFYTPQGQCEKRLPLLMLVFPDWFKKKYAAAIANVQRNARMLTSHFDLHRTLLDLMNLNSLKNDSRLRRSPEEEDSGEGRSLFLPMSANRTCKQASIPPEYCACDCLNLPVPRRRCFWLWEIINIFLIFIILACVYVINKRQNASREHR